MGRRSLRVLTPMPADAGAGRDAGAAPARPPGPRSPLAAPTVRDRLCGCADTCELRALAGLDASWRRHVHSDAGRRADADGGDGGGGLGAEPWRARVWSPQRHGFPRPRRAVDGADQRAGASSRCAGAILSLHIGRRGVALAEALWPVLREAQSLEDAAETMWYVAETRPGERLVPRAILVDDGEAAGGVLAGAYRHCFHPVASALTARPGAPLGLALVERCRRLAEAADAVQGCLLFCAADDFRGDLEASAARQIVRSWADHVDPGGGGDALAALFCGSGADSPSASAQAVADLVQGGVSAGVVFSDAALAAAAGGRLRSCVPDARARAAAVAAPRDFVAARWLDLFTHSLRTAAADPAPSGTRMSPASLAGTPAALEWDPFADPAEAAAAAGGGRREASGAPRAPGSHAAAFSLGDLLEACGTHWHPSLRFLLPSLAPAAAASAEGLAEDLRGLYGPGVLLLDPDLGGAGCLSERGRLLATKIFARGLAGGEEALLAAAGGAALRRHLRFASVAPRDVPCEAQPAAAGGRQLKPQRGARHVRRGAVRFETTSLRRDTAQHNTARRRLRARVCIVYPYRASTDMVNSPME